MDAIDRAGLRREAVRLAWPVLLQNFLRTVMFLVDTAMVKELGAEAVATMGIVGPIMYTIVSLFTAVGVGATALVARAWGAKDMALARREAAAAVVLALGAGVVALPAGLLLLPRLTGFYRIEGSFADAFAADYVAIVAWSFPFILLDFASAGVLRGAGDTRTPMWIAAGANALNVVLNYALIFGRFGAPALGIAGAALATCVSLAAQGAATTAWLGTRWSRVRIGPRDLFGVARASLARAARVSAPAGVEPVILQGGFLVYTKFIAMLGEGAMAAHRSAIAVESLSFMPGYGVGVACGVLVGQMLGARRPDRARAAFGESARIGVLLMTLLGVLFAAIPAVLLWPFVPSDPEVLAQAVRVLRIAGIEQPLMALAFVLTGGLRGAGDTRSPVWIAAAGTWGVRVPISYVTAHVLGWGLAGVWITMVLDWGVRAVLAGIVVRRGAWARLSL